MPPPRFAHPFADRDLNRMAWTPSYRAPRAADVLRPPPFVVPPLAAEEARLLEAVAADPDADGPRLAFAEWCQAELSRRSTQMNTDQQRMNSDPSSADPRSSAFISGHYSWSSLLAPFGAADVEIVRGFPEAMSLAGRSFISLGAELVKRVPLRRLRLVAVQPFMGELAGCAHLRRVERLSLAGNRVGPAGVRALAGSPHLHSLTSLDLSRNDLGADGVRELLRAPWLPRLRSLIVEGNGLTPADLAALSAARVGTT